MAQRSNNQNVWIDEDGTIHVNEPQRPSQPPQPDPGSNTSRVIIGVVATCLAAGVIAFLVTTLGSGSGKSNDVAASGQSVSLTKDVSSSESSNNTSSGYSHSPSDDSSSSSSSGSTSGSSSGSSGSSSSSSSATVTADSNGMVTLSGTVSRDEQTTSETGMGWSRVVYYLDLDKMYTIQYKDAYGGTAQSDMTRIAIDVAEQYADKADRDLGSVTIPKWEQLLGQHVTVRGKTFSNGNAHTVGDVMLTEATAEGSTRGSKSESNTSSQLVVKPMDTGSNGYVLPKSDSHRYTESELSPLSNWELYIARNEIPARHGLIFANDDLNDYFNSKTWYRGTLTGEEFRSIEGILNATEEANVNTILDIEKKRDSSYRPEV